MLEKLICYLERLSIFLIAVALMAGMVGCAPAQYNLTISSTEGGEAQAQRIPKAEIAH